MFNFTLNYNDPSIAVSKRLYNGNIAQTSWQTANTDSSRKTYNYTYDAFDRLLSATATTISNYNVSDITYDKNGNILSLQRKGHLNTGATIFGTMDNLRYTYDSGNKLLKVTDAANKTYGFKDGTNTGNDFSFDVNGNQIQDLNKGVTSVLYNHLNMPTEIKFNNSNTKKINYIYDANGIKLRKTTNNNGAVTTTDYVGSFVYENNTFKQLSQPEGYVTYSSSKGYEYVYQYRDIWRNARVTYSDINKDGVITPSTEILREQNYYPFGLEHRGYNTSIIGAKNNLKQYQAQEFTEDLGLNTHEWKYRVSDPATGRFWQVDPLAEDYVYNSTYAFQENKMGKGIELEGLELAEWYPEGTSDPAFNTEGGTVIVNTIIDEIPVVGEVKDISEGNYFAAALGIIPFGKKLGQAFSWIKKKFSKKTENVTEIVIDATKHPESAKHLDEAIKAGKKNVGVVDRANASKRRKENLKNIKTKKGKDRDEAPPAVINTGEKASVKHINPSDNRGAGSSIRHQLKNVKNGEKVKIVPKNLDKIQS